MCKDSQVSERSVFARHAARTGFAAEKWSVEDRRGEDRAGASCGWSLPQGSGLLTAPQHRHLQSQRKPTAATPAVCRRGGGRKTAPLT